MKPEAIGQLYGGKSTQTGGPEGKYVMYALGAEFVEVRIHALTREIRVPRIVGAFAGGRIMNTRTARSQYMGGMIWGISSALHEATEIDRKRARYVNDNLADYLVPMAPEMPDIVCAHVETPTRQSQLGAKGVGEAGTAGAPAAVMNAINDALAPHGARVTRMPFTPERILDGIARARTRA